MFDYQKYSQLLNSLKHVNKYRYGACVETPPVGDRVGTKVFDLRETDGCYLILSWKPELRAMPLLDLALTSIRLKYFVVHLIKGRMNIQTNRVYVRAAIKAIEGKAKTFAGRDGKVRPVSTKLFTKYANTVTGDIQGIVNVAFTYPETLRFYNKHLRRVFSNFLGARGMERGEAKKYFEVFVRPLKPRLRKEFWAKAGGNHQGSPAP